MKICFDLDGVLCQLKKNGQSYSDLEPIPGAVEKLRKLKSKGHYIVIATARHMRSCDQNVGKVVARQGLATLEWLKRHHFEFDEIWFGKPHCDIYIDDNGYRFSSMEHILDDGSNLPKATEETERSV